MAGNLSLAEQAVQTLEAVRQMEHGIELNNPERHIVRSMKRVAEQAIEAGLRIAQDLAWQAQNVRQLPAEIREQDAKP